MSDLNAELPSACAAACPTAAWRQLSELSRQYVPAEAWLFADPQTSDAVGLYSANAIRTVANNFQISCPPDRPRYGMPRNIGDPNNFRLASMQHSIDNGRHVTPDDITLLTELATQRTNERNQFDVLPVADRQRLSRLAQPLLNGVAISLLDKNPELAELQELADILKARKEEPKIVSFAKDLLGAVTGIEHVHMLDQAPFFLARRALGACGGPMGYIKPRFYIWGTVRGQVCPNGKRNMKYFTAQVQAER